MKRFPADLALLLGPLIAVPIALLGSWVPVYIINAKRSGNMTAVWVGAGAGAIGIILLFLARLPLYRQRRFLTFGSKELDARHKRLYFWAFCFVAVSIALLALMLVRLAT